MVWYGKLCTSIYIDVKLKNSTVAAAALQTWDEKRTCLLWVESALLYLLLSNHLTSKLTFSISNIILKFQKSMANFGEISYVSVILYLLVLTDIVLYSSSEWVCSR